MLPSRPTEPEPHVLASVFIDDITAARLEAIASDIGRPVDELMENCIAETALHACNMLADAARERIAARARAIGAEKESGSWTPGPPSPPVAQPGVTPAAPPASVPPLDQAEARARALTLAAHMDVVRETAAGPETPGHSRLGDYAWLGELASFQGGIVRMALGDGHEASRAVIAAFRSMANRFATNAQDERAYMRAETTGYAILEHRIRAATLDHAAQALTEKAELYESHLAARDRQATEPQSPKPDGTE